LLRPEADIQEEAALVYTVPMVDLPQCSDDEFEQRIRRALKTPPISNEEIVRRSKEARKG